MILWGPPGSGKTTLARLIATMTRAHFAPVSAVASGVAELRRIVQEAKELMVHGGIKLLQFGVTDEQAWEVGLACGGEVEIYIERVE